MNTLFLLALLGVLVIVKVDGSPWIFQEIKPITVSESMKKSSVPIEPIKDIDPSTNLIHIKQDIREDIVGSNGTTAKYKEGVKKLLDFLEAGPMDDGKSDDKPKDVPASSPKNSTQGDQHQQTQAKSDDSVDDSITKILLQVEKLKSNNQLSKTQVNSAHEQTNLVDNSSSLVKTNAILPQDNTTANYNSQTRPPASNVAQMTSQQMTSPQVMSPAMASQQHGLYAKSQIPFNSASTIYGKQSATMKSNVPQNSQYAKSQIPFNSASTIYGKQSATMKSNVPQNSLYAKSQIPFNLASTIYGKQSATMKSNVPQNSLYAKSQIPYNSASTIYGKQSATMKGNVPQNSLYAKSQIPLNSASTIYGKQSATMKGNVPQNSLYAKSQIPLNSASTIYGKQSATMKGNVPYSPVTAYHPYHPYTTYQRPPLPYGWFNSKRYNVPIKAQPINHYPAYQPAVKSNIHSTRSKVPLPLYRNPYQHQPAYAKTYIPNHYANLYRRPLIRKPAMSTAAGMRLSTISHAHAPIFQRSPIAHASFYRQPMPWNGVPHAAVQYPNNANVMKYRRMAISGRGHAYNGLKSTREKVAQKAPLPLPLASIMTAARIVVPARPYNLNGALKSSVETLQSEDSEEKSAGAV